MLAIREIGRLQGRRDQGMRVQLDLGDPGHRDLLETFGVYSIDATVQDERGHLFGVHDGRALGAELTPEELATLRTAGHELGADVDELFGHFHEEHRLARALLATGRHILALVGLVALLAWAMWTVLS